MFKFDSNLLKDYKPTQEEIDNFLNEMKAPYENDYPIKDPINGVIYKYVLEMSDGKFAYFDRENISGTHFPIQHFSNYSQASLFYEEELPELNYYINDLNKFVKQSWDIDNDTEYNWHPWNHKDWEQKDYFVPKQIRRIKIEIQ
jgi:hypothetical protein